MTDVLMPALSPTMEEGTLAKWLVKAGDKVSSGDVIAEIETDKATMEVEAVDEGVVESILVPEGAEGVKVNTVIARLAGDLGVDALGGEPNQDDRMPPKDGVLPVVGRTAVEEKGHGRVLPVGCTRWTDGVRPAGRNVDGRRDAAHRALLVVKEPRLERAYDSIKRPVGRTSR